MEELKNRALQMVKKVVKFAIKAILRIFMPLIAGIVVILLLISSFVYFITVDDGTYKEGDWESPGYGAAMYKSEMKISKDGTITSNKTAQEIWDEMIKNNSKVDKYLSGPEALAKLMNAELTTQFPDMRPNPDEPINWKEIDLTQNQIQGIIKLKRADEEGNISTLKYTDIETFYNWIEEYNQDGNETARQNALSHFTLKENVNVAENYSVTDMTTDISDAIVKAAKETPSPGKGLCQAWVRQVYANAGLENRYIATAYKAYKMNSISDSKDNIPVGAAVYGTGTGSAGHVGIYIGNGQVMDNVGYIRTISLEDWIAKEEGKGNTLDGKCGWLGWGWQAGQPTTITQNSNGGEIENGRITTKAKSYCIEVATWEEEETTLETDDPNQKEKNTTKYNMQTQTINYQEMTRNYSMPFNFLWALLVVGEDEDFVLELSDLVYNSEIEITVHDNYTKNTDEQKWTYTQHDRNIVSATVRETTYYPNIIRYTGEFEDTKENEYTTTKTIITQTNNLDIGVTKANVWMVDYEKKYQHEKSKPNTSPTEDNKKDDVKEKKEPTSTSDTYKDEKISSLELEVSNEARQRGASSPNVETITNVKTYTSYKNIINHETNTVETSNYTAEPPTLQEKTDKNSQEPNFVTIFNKKEYSHNKSNIKNVASWLFEILETNEDTSNMVDLMKYLLYKATGKNYGITEFDFSVFYPSQLTTVGANDYIVHIEKSPEEIVIKDVETLKKAFSWYSGSSKLIKYADIFLDFQEKYKVNAVFAAAVSIKETSAGRAGHAIDGKNNWFNIECRCGEDSHGRYETYGSERESIEAFYNTIKNGSHYFTQGRYSVATIGPTYCENAEQGWIPNTLTYMTKMFQAAGINTTAYAGGGVQYYQSDYSNVPYGHGGTIATSGCGPTCFAMVATQITGKQITPKDAVDWCGDKYYGKGGTTWDYYQAAANHFGLNVTVRQTVNIEEVIGALRNGKLVISSQGRGLFTDGGHLIVLYKVDNNDRIYVKDPNKANAIKRGYNTRAFSKNEIDAAAKNYFIFE